MYCTNHYVIKWEDVKTIDDIKRLLAAAEITFEPDFKNLESIKDLVELVPKRSYVNLYIDC